MELNEISCIFLLYIFNVYVTLRLKEFELYNSHFAFCSSEKYRRMQQLSCINFLPNELTMLQSTQRCFKNIISGHSPVTVIGMAVCTGIHRIRGKYGTHLSLVYDNDRMLPHFNAVVGKLDKIKIGTLHTAFPSNVHIFTAKQSDDHNRWSL